MVYEEKRSYHSAVRFYKRFLGFAKAMEDKIGMSLGANRVAVNLFYEGLIQKSSLEIEIQTNIKRLTRTSL